MRERVYLDTNALRDLWRATCVSPRLLQRVRSRLASPLFARRPTLVISAELVHELTDAASAPAHWVQVRQQIEWLMQLPELEVPRGLDDAIRAALAGDRAVYDPDRVAGTLRRVLEQGPVVDEARHQNAQFREHFGQLETEIRHGLRSIYGDQVPKFAIEFGRALDERVADSCRDQFKARHRLWNLPKDPASWPDPRTIRPLWFSMSYLLARAVVVHRDRRAIDENDVIDWRHYAAAAQADVLVTSDKKFRDVLSMCPAPKPTVLTFEEWADGVLRDATEMAS